MPALVRIEQSHGGLYRVAPREIVDFIEVRLRAGIGLISLIRCWSESGGGIKRVAMATRE